MVSSFLYLVGYDGLYSDNWAMKCFLAIIGILALSLLSAYLTVLFLCRTDVKICPKFFVWQDAAGEYYCTFVVRNDGKPVCNLSMSINLYNKNGSQIISESCERYRPILLKKSSLNENFRICPTQEPFFYEVFQHFLCKEDCELYVLWSFIDDVTGQETIHTQPYKFDDCVFCMFDEGVSNHRKKYTSDMNIQKNFTDWLQREVYVIPLSKAIPINASAIQLDHFRLPTKQRNTMTMTIDYSQVNLLALDPEFFVMASIQFMIPEDWRVFFDKGWEFQFEMSGDADDIEKVTVEIKKRERLEKVLWNEFKVMNESDQNGDKCILPLQTDGLNREDFREIKEVDFTVFLKHMKNREHPFGRVTIGDCVLAKPSPSKEKNNSSLKESEELCASV